MCALEAAGLALGVVGGLYQGVAQRSASRYNAAMSKQEAKLAQAQGLEQERMQRIQGLKQLGYSRAMIGKSGVTNSGSLLDQLAYSAGDVELDSQKIRANTANNVNSLKAQSKLYKQQGKNAMISAGIGAGTSLLTGISGMAGSSRGSLSQDLGVSQNSWLTKPNNWTANQIRSKYGYKY